MFIKKSSFSVSISVFVSLVFLLPSLYANSHSDEHRLSPREDPAIQHVEAFKIFDNLSFVGIEWVSAYVLETSEGLVLIDSLYEGHMDHLLNGMRKLGYDPADIKAVLCTHGHWDHLGGAAHIQELTGARVGMTDADWKMVESGEVRGEVSIGDLKRDRVIQDGDTLTFGDTTIKCYVTPGHTLGVLSMEFTVYDNGKPHKAFIFGGVGLNFEGVERTEMYIASVKRVMAMQDIEVNPNVS